MSFELTVQRAKALMMKGSRFHVEVDGAEVGKLRPGAQFAASLDEGDHRVRVFVGQATSKVFIVHAGDAGALSLVARPADVDPTARTERLARRDTFALTLSEGDDVSRVGPTLAQAYKAMPASLGNPARTRAQRALWLLALALALTGFILLPIVRNGVGFAFLVVALLIFGWLQIGYLRSRHRT